jgi:BASS family bile acid:Na+ symporter
MDLRELVILAFRVSILCTVFGFGLKTTIADLRSLIRKRALLVRSLVAVFVVMPAVAILLVRSFDLRPTVQIALLALAISPVPPILPLKEVKAGGDTRYALGLMALLSALAIAVVPLELQVLQRVFGLPLTMPEGAVARMVLVGALLPLATGMAVRALAPRLVARIEKPVARVAKVLLPFAAIALFISVAPAIWALIGDGTLVAIGVFLIVGLIVGHLMGGPNPNNAVVLALSTACRHPAIALSIAAANFPDQRFGAAILLYLILSGVAAVPYIAWQRKRQQPQLDRSLAA